MLRYILTILPRKHSSLALCNKSFKKFPRKMKSLKFLKCGLLQAKKLVILDKKEGSKESPV